MNIEYIKEILEQIDLPNTDSSPVQDQSPKTRLPNAASRLINVHANDKQILLLLDATGLPADDQHMLKTTIEAALKSEESIANKSIHVSFSMDTKPQAAKPPHSPKNPMNKKPIPNVKKILIVASGKGGVGKSTTALNLAIAFQQMGLRVGVLDADIYGPSLPLMLGCRDKPDVSDDKKLIPILKHGLSVMSMGFLIDEAMPMIWRGPMVQGALNQLLFEVAWGHQGDLDLLVVDTPPGTGDAHLTLAQQLIVDGAVIVSTPQDMALIDAKKAMAMFDKVSIPVVGMIENMAYFCCPNCGTNTNIFSRDGAHKAADVAGIPFLGAIPLTSAIRIACDAGVPLALSTTEAESAARYTSITELIAARLALK
ncbi:MAG: Mrp/NBP35 family ATP-binding protein [Pseudomonadota bacterium]